LDTIDRSILDFDFEKLCSVSLSNNNVYACLVCGKYFQGKERRLGEESGGGREGRERKGCCDFLPRWLGDHEH